MFSKMTMFSFSMPSFKRTLAKELTPRSCLAPAYLPGVFQVQVFGLLADPGLTARPPEIIDLGVANYLPGIYGSSAFDDALLSVGEDPASFRADSTADELFAAISMFAPP